MPLSRPALACALAAGVLAAIAVAEQRVGLGLSLALLLVVAAGAAGGASRGLLTLAGALALQPLLRDAGWVVAADVAAALLAAAAAAVAPQRWWRVGQVLLAPWRLIAGLTLVARAIGALRPDRPQSQLVPVARGLALATGLSVTFGALFATADRAFADVLDGLVAVDLAADRLAWRCVLALAFTAAAGGLARADALAAPAPDSDGAEAPAYLPGRTELVIALVAVVAVFATFVAVQLRVLFGGADYVQATTGLGYGDYARQGFAQLLVVATLTLGVVAFAARRRDRLVGGLLGVLCLLTLVVLLSAHHRLGLVENAYGFTRVRYTGHAVVAWLAGLFALVVVAGGRPEVARRLPRLATTLTLAAVLLFSLSNPDARIAGRAVDRAAGAGRLDARYLSGLSADAIPALERLPLVRRAVVLPELRARLVRPDGLAGLNLSRMRAR